MSPETRKQPRPSVGRGLLSSDNSEIKLVSAADRDWWGRLSGTAKARFAERHGKKWTDEETTILIKADPGAIDYYGLAEELGRGPGALRARRAMMIHLLKDQYGYLGKARLYAEDPRTYHKFADVAQVYRLLTELGIFSLPVSQQFLVARHLKQPSPGWRGDHSAAVLRQRRERTGALLARLKRRKVDIPGGNGGHAG